MAIEEIYLNIREEAHPKNLLTIAIVAAERLTIKITAMDSLNNFWRVGQTTSFSSFNVSLRKLPPELAVDEASTFEAFSSMGLVTV